MATPIVTRGCAYLHLGNALRLPRAHKSQSDFFELHMAAARTKRRYRPSPGDRPLPPGASSCYVRLMASSLYRLFAQHRPENYRRATAKPVAAIHPTKGMTTVM